MGAGFEIVTGIPKCLQLMNDPDARAPGDYRFDPLGLGGSADLQEREISNGRLAMMAFSGILTQDVITGGKGFPYTFNGPAISSRRSRRPTRSTRSASARRALSTAASKRRGTSTVVLVLTSCPASVD